MAVEHAGDEIPAAEAHARDRAADLRHVADDGVAPCRGPAEDANVAASGGNQSKDGAHQSRLARAIRSEDADEFAGGNLQADSVQNDAPAKRQAYVAKFDRVHPAYLGSARSRASSSPCIHVW